MSAALQVDFAGDNPVINGAGQAQFPAGNFATWKTANGSVSSVVITNPGNQNTLTVVISGAPSTMLTTSGLPFNGQFSILPNQPTSNVAAVGDFQGTIVTVLNMSNPSTICKIVAQKSS